MFMSVAGRVYSKRGSLQLADAGVSEYTETLQPRSCISFDIIMGVIMRIKETFRIVDCCLIDAMVSTAHSILPILRYKDSKSTGEFASTFKAIIFHSNS